MIARKANKTAIFLRFSQLPQGCGKLFKNLFYSA